MRERQLLFILLLICKVRLFQLLVWRSITSHRHLELFWLMIVLGRDRLVLIGVYSLELLIVLFMLLMVVILACFPGLRSICLLFFSSIKRWGIVLAYLGRKRCVLCWINAIWRTDHRRSWWWRGWSLRGWINWLESAILRRHRLLTRRELMNVCSGW